MMKRGNGRRGSRRGSGRTTNTTVRFVTKSSLKTKFSGRKLRPQNDPPSTTIRPWKQQVLVFFGTGSKTFTDSDVTSGISTQNLITIKANATFIIRIQKCYLWQEIPLVTSTSVPQPLKSPLTLKVHSIIGENDQTVITDVGTNVRYAKCGYLWPESQRITPLATADTDKICTVQPVDTDQTWVLHLHVLWTTNDISENIETGTIQNIVDFMKEVQISDSIEMLPSLQK